MFNAHVLEYRRWRYYNCRVTVGSFTYDPEDPFLSISYD